MRPSVFISRDLSPNSILLELAHKKDFKLTGQSLLTFTKVPFHNIPACDWYFFYSQKGVEFFFKQIETNQFLLPSAMKIALMGPKAAAMLDKFGYTTDFIGNGHPDDVSAAFLKNCAPKETVLFIQAKNSRQSVQNRISTVRQTCKMVVYDNIKKPAISLDKHDILIFMSPLNAENYLDHYTISPEQQIICIGNTTAAFLREKGYRSFTPTEPSEKAIANLLSKFL